MREEGSVPTPAPARFVSGFASILGRPNAGKSTLLNQLTGTKLAIVADKPQTTRTTIQGVLTEPEGQVVFLDTPGIHRADSAFNRRMMEAVKAALDQRDLLILVVDAAVPFSSEDREAVDLVARAGAPTMLVLNKIDLLKNKSVLLPLIAQYRSLHDFTDYLPVSAKKGESLDKLRQIIFTHLPEGPLYFPEDHITDQPERFLAAELVREKLLHVTRHEVPHAIAVIIDQWQETPRLTRIVATIYVEKDGQKAIVIGAGGSVLKNAGTLAREEMERLFGVKIFLQLNVKVRAAWRENPVFLNALDWRTMAGTDET